MTSRKVVTTEVREEGGKKIITRRTEIVSSSGKHGSGSSESSSLFNFSSDFKKHLPSTYSSVYTTSETKSFSSKDVKSREAPKITEIREVSGKGAKQRTQSSSSSSSSSSDESDDEFAEKCLEAHNKYRKKHGVKPLKLNKKMCKYSEEWAKHLADTGTFQHRKNNKYGENIFMAGGMKVSGSAAADKWYSEVAQHTFGQEPRGVMRSGHFSQMIWADSKELGVGCAKTKSGQTFVVANYDPRGNMMGQFSSNVPPPK